MEQEKKKIGICVSQIQNDPASNLVRAIEDTALDYHYDTMVFSTFVKMDLPTNFAKGETSIWSNMPMEELCALTILSDTLFNDEIAQKIADSAKKFGIPVISINAKLKGCFNIMLDYRSSFRQIVNHVITQHHCKDIYFMSGYRNNEFSNERLEIFKEELEVNGIECKTDHIAYGDFWEKPAKAACEKWASQWEKAPDAIICANDIMAITCCNVLNEHGWHVPEDCIVTGFDGINLEKYCTPRLTTAQVDIWEIASQTVETIHRVMDNPDLAPEITYVPFNVRYSESCGCKKTDICKPNEHVMKAMGEMEHTRIHVSLMFHMMTLLSDEYSIMRIIPQLKEYLWNLEDNNFLLFLDPSYCQYMDIPVEHLEQAQDKLLVFVNNEQGNITAPLHLIDKSEEYQYISETWPKISRTLAVPFHLQEDVYGHIIVDVTKPITNYHNLYEFVMSLAQVFGTIHKQAELHRLYIIDPLTNVYNRRGFYSVLKQQMRQLGTRKKALFLASIDLDHLKYINDSFGHDQGDFAIKTISKLITECMPENGVCARFGGDEFTAACLFSEEDIDFEVAQKFKKVFFEKLDACTEKYQKPYPIGASCGTVLTKSVEWDDIDELMRLADKQMYHCKERNHAIRQSSR